MTGKHNGATYFISDLHLGAPYFPDSREAEQRVVTFLESIRSDCKRLYMLGDVLDYWYEYRYVVPKGFIRFFGKLAELADSGVEITWMIGNHDIWLFDYLPAEIGLEIIDGPVIRDIEGEKFYLAHGDGLGKTKWTFRVLRSLFRNKFCQWLYAGIHPRWTMKFAQNWSRRSRASGEQTWEERSAKAVEHLYEYSKTVETKHPEIQHFVYGHLHIPLAGKMPGGADFVILGDWIRNFTYARFSPEEGMTLLSYPQNEPCDNEAQHKP